MIVDAVVVDVDELDQLSLLLTMDLCARLELQPNYALPDECHAAIELELERRAEQLELDELEGMRTMLEGARQAWAARLAAIRARAPS